MSQLALAIKNGFEVDATTESPLVADACTCRSANGQANKLLPEDRPVHEWYRFVLSYPPHFVREYLQRFAVTQSHCVLDPFCGTGTTLVECKKTGVPSIGVEVNPVGHFASSVKTDWSPDPEGLAAHALSVFRTATAKTETAFRHVAQSTDSGPGAVSALRALTSAQMGLLLKGSISPLPLHKTLCLLESIAELQDSRYASHELLAAAKVAVQVASNLKFGPEVGVGRRKGDAAVLEAWLSEVRTMALDIRATRGHDNTPASVHCADARRLSDVIAPCSVDAVITSPPYPNEKDYTRTTRLESVLLDFLRDKAQLRSLKKKLLRSNTRGVYKNDDDDRWVKDYPEIERIAREIERRRVELGKTSGFERLYARVTKLYFGGMLRHFDELRTVLRPGAHLAYVVGDQASYLRVMIRTGQILADIAQSLGYELVGIDLIRTRLSTATKEQLREEVVVLRWPG